jgi:hypothetical protein
MEERSQFLHEEALSLCGLPKDVLQIILKKIGLKDRLRLELLDKRHRDVLREPELWHEIDLASMQALNLTEDQLLHLLSRVHPGLEEVSWHIEGMTDIFNEVTKSFLKNDPNPLSELDKISQDFPYLGSDLVSDSEAALFFERLHQKVPESWGVTRVFVETCTIWFADQIHCLRHIGPLMWGFLVSCRSSIKDPADCAKKLLAQLSLSFPRKRPGRLMEVKPKFAACLDVSGAVSLSPAFLAACTVALSAVGFKVSFRMTGDGDPSFPIYHLLNLMRTLAFDCSIHVKLGVTGTYRWTKSLLESVEQTRRDSSEGSGDSTNEVLASLENGLLVAGMMEYSASKAAYRRFLGKILLLVDLRRQIEVAAGRSAGNVGARAKVACETVVFEKLFTVAPTLLDEVQEYLEQSPSNLKLVFRNCLLTPGDFASLGELLEANAARSVSFQQTIFPFRRNNNLPRAESILGPAALQKIDSLQTLELDFPLSLPDVDYAIGFLDKNEEGAKVVVHLRPRFYAGFPDQAQQLFSKLRDLCASERGRRVRIVQHREDNRILRRGGAPETVGRTGEGSLLPI